MNSMMFLFLQWGIKNFTIPIVLGSVHIHKKNSEQVWRL